jgi:CheY-like chemotaxis protein
MMGGEFGRRQPARRRSTFWFSVRWTRPRRHSLPVAAPEGSPSGSWPPPSRRPIPARRGRADQPGSVARLLEDAGLRVDLAETARSPARWPGLQRYVLILMDMQMPRLSGVDAARAIRADSLNRTTPILAMTANVFEDDRRACAEAGMNGHIPKPVDPERLFESMLDALRAAVQTA